VLIVALFLVVGIASLVCGILTIVQSAGLPDWAFERAGSTKLVWIIVPIVLLFFCGPGAIVMYFIWTGTREKVKAAAAQGPPAGYGYQPPYPQQQPPPPPPPPTTPPPGPAPQ
jgi:hypothetical protein